MKLDRNINPGGMGKYALIKLREAPEVFHSDPECQCLAVPRYAIDFGNINGDDPGRDFFVIRMKDRFAGPALRAYAHAISDYLASLPLDDPQRLELVEYHHEIIHLAEAAHRNKAQRTPD